MLAETLHPSPSPDSITMRRTSRWKLCLISVASLLLSLGIIEAALRFTSFRFLLGPTKKELFEIVQHGQFIADSEAGYDLKKNALPSLKRLWFDQMVYPVWTNELGCYDTPLPASEQEKGYGLLLGDSFAYGSNAFHESFGTTIERTIGVRIAKCGISGYGPSQIHKKFLRLQKELRVKPSFVILQYYVGNDLFDDHISPALILQDEFLVPRVNYAASDFSRGHFPVYSQEERKATQEKILREARTGFSSILYNLLLFHLRTPFSPYMKNLAHTPSSHSPSFLPFSNTERAWLEAAWERHKNYLRGLFSDLRQNHIPFLIVAIPTNDQIYPFLMDDSERALNNPDLPDTILKTFFSEEEVPALFLRPYFASVADTTPRPYLNSEYDFFKRFDGHFSAKGDELAGLLTAREILSRGFARGREVELEALQTLLQERLKNNGSKVLLRVTEHGPSRIGDKLACQQLPTGNCAIWMRVEGMTSNTKVFLRNRALPSATDATSRLLTAELPPEISLSEEILVEIRDGERKAEIAY